MKRIILSASSTTHTLGFKVSTVALAFAIVAPCWAADNLAGASTPKPQLNLKNEKQYKRFHQYALRLMESEEFEKARGFLEGYLATVPDDAESLFMMGVLHAYQSEFAQAAQWMRKSVEAGLPAGRVLAGPLDAIAMAERETFFAELLEDFSAKPLHGPLLGNVTADSASFWVRTASPTAVKVEVSESKDFRAIVAIGATRSRASMDRSAVVEVSGLKPDRRYYYRVIVGGAEVSPTDVFSFETGPEFGNHCRFRLAFGGGAGFVPPHEYVWNTIGSFEPLLMLMLGDNVYPDDPESPLVQRYSYHRRQSRPEWKQLTTGVAVYSIWDDHDFSTNDSWGGPLIDTPYWKRDYAWRIFKENWANPGYGGGEDNPGCWYPFSIGDIDFFMLDCRYYRTDPKWRSPSMLGPLQLQWLREQLLRSQGTFKVICSSVPWDFRTKGDSKDTWNGFKEEREKIFSFIEANQIEGVLLISADRHRSDAWRIERPDGYDFIEFNSSRLTNQHVHPEKEEAIFSYNEKQSFGIVDFDTNLADPTATYSVVTIDGEVMHDITVRRSDLGF